MHELALSGLFPLSENDHQFRSAKVKVTHWFSFIVRVRSFFKKCFHSVIDSFKKYLEDTRQGYSWKYLKMQNKILTCVLTMKILCDYCYLFIYCCVCVGDAYILLLLRLLYYFFFLLLISLSHRNLHSLSSIETSTVELKLSHNVLNGISSRSISFSVM